MKCLLNLDTAICLHAENPEKDLKECLVQQMISSTGILPMDCISIVSGLENTVSATMQRKNYSEAVVLIPETTVLELEINMPLVSSHEVAQRIDGGTIRLGHHRSLGYGLCHISEPFSPSVRDFVRYTITADIVDGILVHGGVGVNTDDSVSKKEATSGSNARDVLGRYILPAATIKGTFRSHCKRLVEYFHIVGNGIDAIFGNHSANIDACVVFYDAIIKDAKEKDIFRCHVDKLTGGVFGDGTGYMRDIFLTGKIQMVWDFIPQNCNIDEADVHRLLLFMIQDIQQKRISFGRGRGIGKGFLDVQRATIKLPHEEKGKEILLDYNNTEITDPSGWIPRQFEKKDSMPPIPFVPDAPQNPDMSPLVAGVDAFLRYGRADVLNEYFNDVDYLPLRNILDSMNKFSGAVLLCQSDMIEEDLEELIMALKTFPMESQEREKRPEKVELFARNLNYLLEMFASMCSSETGEGPVKMNPLKVIRWSVDNMLLQPAVSFCVEWLPEYFIDHGVAYTDDTTVQLYCESAFVRNRPGWENFLMFFLLGFSGNLIERIADFASKRHLEITDYKYNFDNERAYYKIEEAKYPEMGRVCHRSAAFSRAMLECGLVKTQLDIDMAVDYIRGYTYIRSALRNKIGHVEIYTIHDYLNDFLNRVEKIADIKNDLQGLWNKETREMQWKERRGQRRII